MRLFNAANLTSRLPSTSHCTPPRRRTRWHLPRRAAACGLAGALLGPAAVGVSALKSEGAGGSFSITLPLCVNPLQRFLFMAAMGCDGD